MSNKTPGYHRYKFRPPTLLKMLFLGGWKRYIYKKSSSIFPNFRNLKVFWFFCETLVFWKKFKFKFFFHKKTSFSKKPLFEKSFDLSRIVRQICCDLFKKSNSESSDIRHFQLASKRRKRKCTRWGDDFLFIFKYGRNIIITNPSFISSNSNLTLVDEKSKFSMCN